MKLLLQEISKSFPGKEVLEGINYTFDQDCLYALLAGTGRGRPPFLRSSPTRSVGTGERSSWRMEGRDVP